MASLYLSTVGKMKKNKAREKKIGSLIENFISK